MEAKFLKVSIENANIFALIFLTVSSLFSSTEMSNCSTEGLALPQMGRKKTVREAS